MYLWCSSICLLCVCFFKGENLLFLECQSKSAHVWTAGSSGYCPSDLNLSTFRDAVTDPILSLMTNHVCSSHFPGSWAFVSNDWDLGAAFDGSCCFSWLSIHVGSQFHTQVMILMRSYNRLSSLSITSLDGCCLYIIIHNSLLQRTWLKRLAHWDGRSTPEKVTTECP